MMAEFIEKTKFSSRQENRLRKNVWGDFLILDFWISFYCSSPPNWQLQRESNFTTENRKREDPTGIRYFKSQNQLSDEKPDIGYQQPSQGMPEVLNDLWYWKGHLVISHHMSYLPPSTARIFWVTSHCRSYFSPRMLLPTRYGKNFVARYLKYNRPIFAQLGITNVVISDYGSMGKNDYT